MSEPLTLSSSQLMSTLAGTASAFVAILAGFYTTKIFSMSTDKKRLEYKVNDLNLEIQHKKETVKIYELQRDKEIEEDEDEMINSFIRHIDSPTTFILESLNSFDKVIKYYVKCYRIEGKVSDREIKKLQEKWQPLIEKFKNIKMPSLADPKYTLVNGAFLKTEEQISREFTRKMEDKKQFERLKEKLRDEQNDIKFLEKQLESNTKELQSITLPQDWRFGYSSFIIFAVLGVIVPITSQWWYFYTKEYTDFLAIISFTIGLGITFLYIGKEIFSIFYANKNC